MVEVMEVLSSTRMTSLDKKTRGEYQNCKVKRNNLLLELMPNYNMLNFLSYHCIIYASTTLCVCDETMKEAKIYKLTVHFPSAPRNSWQETKTNPTSLVICFLLIEFWLWYKCFKIDITLNSEKSGVTSAVAGYFCYSHTQQVLFLEQQETDGGNEERSVTK